jgi:hypothetical protein
MDQRFEFEAADVIALVEESRAAEERLMTEAQRLVAAGVDLRSGELPEEDVDHPGTGAPPGLWLMNDAGVYLRSNAADGGERRAHARGFRAEVAVGDEPMCEFVDAAQLAPLQPGDVLVVTLQEDRMRLSLLRPQ